MNIMTTTLLAIFGWFRILFNHILLSTCSINFYIDVYKSYKGSGLRYLFTLSFMSTLIYAIFIFNHLLCLKDYFTENRISKSTTTIEYILKRLPNIYYNGNKILVDQDEPIYLLTEKGNKIAIIDSKNQLPYGEKIKIPVLFSSNKVILSTVEITDNKKSMFSTEYTKIFGPTPQNLTEAVIKKQFARILAPAPRLFIYIGLPIMILVFFLSLLFEKSLIVILVYVLTNFFGIKSSLQTCTRVVVFSTGATILLQPIIVIFAPKLISIVFVIQMIANVLLFFALLNIRSRKFKV